MKSAERSIRPENMENENSMRPNREKAEEGELDKEFAYILRLSQYYSIDLEAFHSHSLSIICFFCEYFFSRFHFTKCLS